MSKNLLKIDEGQYNIISNYSNKDYFIKKAREEIYDCISSIAGLSVSKKIRQKGLDKMHLYFNPDYLPFLNVALKKKMNEVMAKQIFYIGQNNLKLNKAKSFYIDQTMNYRIIYPYELAKKSQLTRSIYLSLDLENYKNADKEINRGKIKAKKFTKNESYLNKIKYFKNLPITCYGHGPHRDTWFGHTFGALNLWWSITGVNQESGLVLYPEVTNFEIEHIKEPAYVAPNQYLKKPKIIALKDGDLLVFDPEILHATKLNTSNQTRIVFSGRINKDKPTFYKKTNAPEYPHWFSSKDFSLSQFNKTHFFFRKNNSIIKKKKKKLNIRNYIEIKIKKNLISNSIFKLTDQRKIKKNKLYKIKFKNLDLCMVYSNRKAKVFFSKCPHLGVSLLDGYFNKRHIICPGHALSFNLKDGKSKCEKLNLKFYKVKEKDNTLFLYT